MLKKILYANAIFCLVNTIALLLAPQIMADFLLSAEFAFFGFSASTTLQFLGIGLFSFAAFVTIIATNLPQFITYVKFIIIADGAWVVSTLLLFVFANKAFSSSGIMFFSVVAIVVAVFGLLQIKHSKNGV